MNKAIKSDFLKKSNLFENSYLDLLFHTLNSLDKSIAILNPEFKYLFINEEHFRLFNIPVENIIGHYVSDFQDLSYYNESIKPKLEECLKGNEVNYLNKLPINNGFIYLNSNYKPLYIEDKIEGIISTVIDITENEYLKQKLKEEEKKWLNSIDALDDLVLIISKEHEIEAINKKGVELINLNKEEIIGKKCYDIIEICKSHGDNCIIKKALASRQTESIIKSNNSQTYYSVKLTPIIDNDGTINRFIDIQRDISEIKIREIELQNKNEEIAAQNEEYLTVAEELRQRNNEYKSVNSELLKSENNFRQLFDLMLDAYALHEIICDKKNNPIDYRFLEINQTFEKITGLKKEQIIGKTVKEVMPETEDFWIQHYGRVALTGEIFEFENFSKELDRYYAGKAYSPQKKQFVVVFNEVTERKKNELRLKQASEIFENIQIGLHIYKIEDIENDATLQLISANPAASQFTGTDNSKFIGKKIDECFPKLRDFNIPQIYADVIRTQEPALVEKLHYKDVNVKEGYFIVKAFPLPENKVGVAFENITLQFKYQEKLKESEKFNKTLIESVAEGIIVYDFNCNYLVWNNFMEVFTGIPAIEIIGKNAMKMSIIGGEKMNSLLIEALKGHIVISEDLIFINKKTLQKRWLSATFSPHNNENDETIGIVAVIQDITIRKETEEYKELFNRELIVAKEKAEESDKLKTAFLTNMSHEIRTPMNGIIGFSQMLNSKNLSDDKRNIFTNIINESCEQLLRIVDDILDISKIETKQFKINNDIVNINDVFKDLTEIYTLKIKDSNLKFLTNKGLDDLNSTIITDENKFIKILNNLLNNAVKFTSEGYIEFGYVLQQNYLKFYIKDTGIGIPNDFKHKIFERFRQAEITLSRRYGGTGLGLSISKGFVEMLGGKIWFESEEEKGSIFYFTIPYNHTGLKTIVNYTEEKLYNEDFTGIKILIAEDEIINFFYLKEILLSTNASILHAKNGEEAVELFRQNRDISLILMDLKMPLLNGYDAAQQIRKINPEICIIAQTAFAQDEGIIKAKELGFNDYITKPIKKEVLIKKIKKYLGK